MTYQELSAKYNEDQLPITTISDRGVSETIFHGIDRWTYKDLVWNRPYFMIKTRLENGHIRYQYFFKDGKTEEFYEIPH